MVDLLHVSSASVAVAVVVAANPGLPAAPGDGGGGGGAAAAGGAAPPLGGEARPEQPRRHGRAGGSRSAHAHTAGRAGEKKI